MCDDCDEQCPNAAPNRGRGQWYGMVILATLCLVGEKVIMAAKCLPQTTPPDIIGKMR